MMKMIKEKTTVGVPCAATEMAIPPTVLGQRHMIARLKYFCERKEKRITNDEEEQLCAEGNQLIRWAKEMNEKITTYVATRTAMNY